MKNRVIALMAAILLVLPLSVTGYTAEYIPEEYLEYAEGIMKAAKRSLSKYTFPEESLITKETIGDVMSLVYNEDPYMFNLKNGYSFSYRTDPVTGEKRVSAVFLEYTMTKDEYAAAVAEVEAWVENVVSLTDPSFTDMEYALFFHDYLCANYDYDTNYESRSIYSFIKTGVGVCQSYTFAYMALLDRVGIEASWASSSEMNHVWNLVRIDGEWYHVDVTWDDPIGGAIGNACHNFFLMSDTAISTAENSHYGWISLYDCTSDKYDSAVFDTAQSIYAYADDMWYYVKDGDLWYVETPGKRGDVFTELGMYWMVWGSDTAFYVNSYSTVYSIGGKLYMNTPTEIIEVDPVTGDSKTNHRYGGSDGYIYGYVIDMGSDGVSGAGIPLGDVKLNIGTDPNVAGRPVAANLFGKKSQGTQDVLKGDANSDGKVNLSDVSLILQYVAKWSVTPNVEASDYDSNGAVNLADVTGVLKLIAGWGK